MHCTLNTKAPAQPDMSSHTQRHTVTFILVPKEMFGKENNRRMNLFSWKMQNPVLCKEGGHKSSRMHPNYSRHGLRATGDLCPAVTPVRVTGASSAEFGMILAAVGSLSAQAGSCRMQKLLKRGHCSQLLRGTLQELQDPGQSHTSQQHRHSLGAALPKSSGTPPSFGHS